MPFFDSADLGDPAAQSALGYLSGLAKGFANGAMPSRAPIPFGASLGMAASDANEGAQTGAHNAQAYRGGQLDLAGKTVSNDQALIIENMLRKALGKPELTAADLNGTSGRSPLFGLPTTSPKAAPVTVPGTAPAPSDAAPAPTEGAAPTEAAQGGGSNNLGNALVSKMLGFAPTDYQRAKMAADLMPPGPARDEAQLAAAHAAGIAVSSDVRPGGVQTIYNPKSGKYEVAFKNPNLPEGYTLGPNGEAEAVPGGPEAVSDIAARKAGANAQGRIRAAAGENYIETGGMGVGTPEGDIKGAAPIKPDFAARVAQLEGGGQAAPPPNANSSAAGAHQFLNGTWLEQAKAVLPKEATAGKTDEQILAMRSDPQISSAVTTAYAANNSKSLDSAGIKNVGPAELYLAHHFGADGAATILKAPANTPLSQLLPAKVMQANPDLADATVADVYSHARQAMKGVAAPTEQKAQVTSGNTGGVKSVIPPSSEAAEIPKGEIYLKDRIPQWAKQEDEWADALPSNTVGEQRALAIADALKATQSGHWAQDKAEIAAKLKAVGLGALANNKIFGDPAAVQTALKDNFAATLAQIRAFTSRPAAVEVTLASKNFANPDLQPEANLKIIGQTVGSMRWERALMNDWAVAKGQGWKDPQDFQRAWIQKNPLQKYIDSATKEIGPLKGMAPDKATPEGQHLITAESIAHTAQTHGQTVEQVKAALKAKGYQVPD